MEKRPGVFVGARSDSPRRHWIWAAWSHMLSPTMRVVVGLGCGGHPGQGACEYATRARQDATTGEMPASPKPMLGDTAAQCQHE